jgi:hypothetical protein
MADRLRQATEAVPKVFQTFNSLLGGIVRKRNATIVGPSKQLVGEFPEVDFERLYQYYHHWDQIKTAVDVMHQKFRGSGIEIKSNNEYFNVFIEKWWDVTNSEKKWSQFIFSLLITGSAIMELQYTPDQRLGNTEQIPMQTIYRLFRDQFGNELKIVQIVDGVFKELDPQFFIHATINNPDRQAFGKSMFHTLATPRPITGTIDPFTGEAINPARQSIPLLDAQAELQNAEIEIKKKMAKPRMLVSAVGMPRDQMDKVQAEMADPNTDQYIWIFDKPIQSAELQIQPQGKFDEYGNNVDAHIDVGTIFASNVIKNPQGFSYSGSQTPFDVLDQRMGDLQSELCETIKDRLLKPIAESWGFQDFEAMEVEVGFTPTMKRLTMEDIRGLDPEAVSKKEIREMYKKLNIPLDDKLWEEEQQELKQDKQDQKNIQMQDAMTQDIAGQGQGEGGDPASGDNPFKTPPADGEDKQKAPASQGGVQAPKVSEPKTGAKSPFEMDRPTPTPTTTPQPEKKPRGENLHTRLMKEIANEGLSAKETIEAIKAIERIPLPPKAGDNSNSSSDLYVSQGLDDINGTPEITDPAIRDEYGLDKDDSETPPSDPSKMARGGDRPALQPADNTAGRFTNADDQGIPQIDEVPEVSLDEYNKHLEASGGMAGDDTQGGLGNDGIDPNSDGSFKDPNDLNNDMELSPDTPQANADPHAGPNKDPLVADNIANTPTDMTMKVTGGSDALPDNTNKQILGANDEDEQPIVPSEGFTPDFDKEELKKKEDRQNLEEAVKPTMMEKPKVQKPEAPNVMHRDIKEGEDPFTSGTGDEPSPELNNQPQKGQAQLDDTPLNDPSANKGNINGINPARQDASQVPFDTEPTEQLGLDGMANDGMPDEATKFEAPADPDGTNNLGDSSQMRLHDEEQTGLPQDPLLPNDSNSILDNTGLNMKPNSQQVQDGSNPLEQEGEPLEDGAIIKPEDIQQNDGRAGLDGLGGTPLTPEGQTALDQDPNTINDPSDSGIDEEQIDPNVLHTDPETGMNYTDLTDEQGNEVPDLRFDQEPDSDEEQPEVELEYEIVTKEEYDQHLDASKGQLSDPLTDPMADPMTQDGFNAELNDPSMDTLETTPEEFTPEEDNPLDPTETDEDGNPKELEMADQGLEEPEQKASPKSSSKPDADSDTPKDSSPQSKGSGDANINDSEDEETSQNSDSQKSEDKTDSEDKKDDDKPKSKPKKKAKTDTKKDDKDNKKQAKKEGGDKETVDKDKDEATDLVDEEPKNITGSVQDIIEREHELLDANVPEETAHKLLEDEFGEEIADDAFDQEEDFDEEK